MKQTQSDVTKERLFQEFNTVVAESEQLLKSVATAGTDQASALQASVEQTIAAAVDRVAKIREDALSQANAAARATDEYVKGNPWRAVGIVAGAAAITGLVAGLLITRR